MKSKLWNPLKLLLWKLGELATAVLVLFVLMMCSIAWMKLLSLGHR